MILLLLPPLSHIPLGLKEERVSLLESWRSSERTFGDLGEVTAVEKKLPRKIKMRRMATAEVSVRVCGVVWCEKCHYAVHEVIKCCLTRSGVMLYLMT